MLLTFPLNIVLATLPMAMSKYPMRANWGVKEYLGLQFEHSGRDVRQLASRVTLSAVRKERGRMLLFHLLPPLLSSMDPSPSDGITFIRLGLPTSGKYLWKCPHTHA